MFSGLLPRETGFFDLFDKHASIVIRAAELFRTLCQEGQGIPEKTKQIRILEQDADQITHQTIEMLHKTFITPIDRDDIFRFISLLDDVIDSIYAAADNLFTYKIAVILPSAKPFSNLLVIATQELAEAIKGLRSMENSEKIRSHCSNINRLQNEAILVLRDAIAHLFDEEKDTRTLIKWKDVYENLRKAIDSCEDVGNLVEGVTLEYG